MIGIATCGYLELYITKKDSAHTSYRNKRWFNLEEYLD